MIIKAVLVEDRVVLLENQVQEIFDMLEQIARDADLLNGNIMRALKKLQPQRTAPTQQNAGLTWDPTKIKWTKDVGLKGEYERSDDVNSLDFKAMLKDLGEHQGKLNRDGRFYWTFQNGNVVGRTMPK
jgi:hypothetical protein